jgi:hypothetical protein
MHNHAKQENIQTPAKLADNLIGSLGGLTAIDRAELRSQVVMLINHSYALGYAAGNGVGIVARMRSKLARVRRRAGHDIKLALSAVRERLTLSFRGHDPRSHAIWAPIFITPYSLRGGVTLEAESVNYFQINRAYRAAALLAPPEDWRPPSQLPQLCAGSPDQEPKRAPEGFSSQFRVTREMGYSAVIPHRLFRSSMGVVYK